MSVGEIGAQALDASVVTTEPESPAHKAALLAEAEGQLAALDRAVEGTAAKLAKFTALHDGALSDHNNAVSERDIVTARVNALRAELGV